MAGLLRCRPDSAGTRLRNMIGYRDARTERSKKNRSPYWRQPPSPMGSDRALRRAVDWFPYRGAQEKDPLLNDDAVVQEPLEV